jgi:chemotaxis protein methyltransferase CheR
MITTELLDPVSFDFLCTLVRDRSAIVLQESKMYLIESRLSPIAKAEGLRDVQELVDKIRQTKNPRLIQTVIEKMTTNETSFFRDLHPFDALKSQIIPELLEKRSKEKRINIWSNACSSGQEIYSVAMLIKESFPQLKDWRINLLATDLSTEILERAKSGIFNQTEVNRGLPMPLLLKYFTKEGLQWRIKDEIKNMVSFQCLNLITPFPPLQKFDVVFLRNVLIYFDAETKTKILQKIQSLMLPDSYLFLGAAETTLGLTTSLQRVPVQKTFAFQLS